jgi:hypothetical protein
VKHGIAPRERRGERRGSEDVSAHGMQTRLRRELGRIAYDRHDFVTAREQSRDHRSA